MRKTALVLLIVLALLSTSLFAQGGVEKAENEKLIKVTALTQSDKGVYSVEGEYSDGSKAIYHLSEDTKIDFPIEDIKPGMYLYMGDKGMMTMSIPPQLPCSSVRNVTMAVNGGIINFKEPLNLQVSNVNLDDLFSAFSYAYGYLTTQNYINNNIVFDAGYYARGILDAGKYGEIEPFYTLEEMDGYVSKYVTEVLQQGILGEVGQVYTTSDEILALPEPTELNKQFAYSYGYLISLELLFQGYDLVSPDFATGVLYALYGEEPLLSEEDLVAKIDAYNQYLLDKYTKIMEQIASDNLAQAESFLAENGAREGVVTLDSGVQIELIGQDAEPGAMPSKTDSVVVDYTLTLLDGTVADKGEKVTFNLDSLIPGFAEAVANMHVGDTIIAYIPPELGYGESGAGNMIAPNSLLTFTIYLDSIVQDAE